MLVRYLSDSLRLVEGAMKKSAASEAQLVSQRASIVSSASLSYSRERIHKSFCHSCRSHKRSAKSSPPPRSFLLSQGVPCGGIQRCRMCHICIA